MAPEIQFRDILAKLVEKKDMAPDEAAAAMTIIMGGNATPAQAGAFLAALRMKGETAGEIAALAQVMKAHAVTVTPVTGKPLVDTCGTGGDGSQTFNISTTSAFVAAGAGVPIVKHGNRAVSSRCGSADVLAALGVSLVADPVVQARIVERVGIAFFFAPVHHPAMRHVAAVRQETGFRTVFNILGPLSNPAGAQAQLLGVYSPHLTGPLAEVLRLLGMYRAMVVHGSGLDEITTTGETNVAELNGTTITTYTIAPETYGISHAERADLAGGDAVVNSRILLDVLDGETGAARDIVMLNAAAAIYLGGQARNLHEGVRLAEVSIDSGSARARLDALIDATREAA